MPIILLYKCLLLNVVDKMIASTSRSARVPDRKPILLQPRAVPRHPLPPRLPHPLLHPLLHPPPPLLLRVVVLVLVLERRVDLVKDEEDEGSRSV
jgi:hypothetical protein